MRRVKEDILSLNLVHAAAMVRFKDNIKPGVFYLYIKTHMKIIIKNILIYILVLQPNAHLADNSYLQDSIYPLNSLRPKASVLSNKIIVFSDPSSPAQDILEQAKRELNERDLLNRIEDICDQGFDERHDRDKWGIFFATPTLRALQITEYIKRNWPMAKVCDIGSGNGKFAFLASARGMPLAKGFEAREGLYDISLRNKKELGLDNIEFTHADFLSEQADLSLYDVLYFFYTAPGHDKTGEESRRMMREFNIRLNEKLLNDTHGMKPGARLIVLGDFSNLILSDDILYENIQVGNVPGISMYTRVKSSSAGQKWPKVSQVIEDKTIHIPMPMPGSSAERSTELRIHKNIIDKIHPEDLDGIKRFVMQNRPSVKDERTDAYPLRHPITVMWNKTKLKIIDIYAKGVLFDSNKGLMPYYGIGFSERRLHVHDNGTIEIASYSPHPQGACLLEEAEREFLVTDAMFFSDYFRKGKIMTKYPIGVGRFPGISYSFADGHNKRSGTEDLGFVLFGCNGFQNMRFSKAIFDEAEQVVEAVERAARMLRLMHEHGLSHPWFHMGNFFTAENFSSVHDLGSSTYTAIDDISRDAFTAQIIADLYYASKKLEEGHGLIAELFLAFYFKSPVLSKSESFLQILGQVFRQIQTIPVADIDQPLTNIIRDKIIPRAYADKNNFTNLPVPPLEKYLIDKNISRAA
jgi:hypothetical protein